MYRSELLSKAVPGTDLGGSLCGLLCTARAFLECAVKSGRVRRAEGNLVEGKA
jgi:hypothetical protein